VCYVCMSSNRDIHKLCCPEPWRDTGRGSVLARGTVGCPSKGCVKTPIPGLGLGLGDIGETLRKQRLAVD
jgi:hypothetical protein